jgi:DNA topoisomerase-1
MAAGWKLRGSWTTDIGIQSWTDRDRKRRRRGTGVPIPADSEFGLCGATDAADTTDALSIRRRRSGRGWIQIGIDERPIQDPRIVRQFTRLAVPPAYQDVLYAADPAAHLQVVGRDAAGRLQYRYHSQWEDVRESRKARRLARLAHALPQVRRSLGQYLAADNQTREFACAAVIELVACSAIRPGSED